MKEEAPIKLNVEIDSNLIIIEGEKFCLNSLKELLRYGSKDTDARWYDFDECDECLEKARCPQNVLDHNNLSEAIQKAKKREAKIVNPIECGARQTTCAGC